MAEGVVLFGVQKLWELLSRESERLQGVHEQVCELQRQLGRLQSLLNDADAKKHESKRVRNFLEDVKDIVYDAEDIIETFLLNEEREKEKGIKKSARRLACFLVDRRKFDSDIKGITMRISDVIGEMQSVGILEIIDGGRFLSMQDREREIRQTFPNNSETGLVEMEQSVEELVGCLVVSNDIQVVSISGMGGIGKTTLTRQVFHHDMVRHHFERFTWVCVSKDFTQKHVWQRIFHDLSQHDADIFQIDEHTLQGKLFKLLETGRYLIVLDDVWKVEDWDRIKAVFPQNGGCKILLTSRNEGVGLHADPTCFFFRLRSLSHEQSWTLCQRIAFPKRDKEEFRTEEELEAMGKKMVTYCGGLPLAVKVLGGLLATKHTIPGWKNVYDNIGSYIVGGSGGLDDNNLNSVYRAAEGIITSHYGGATIRDSAEGYLEELVRRNMVIAERNYATSRFDYCHMHDIMREVCLSKAEEENFLQIIKPPTSTSTFNAQPPNRSRRLAVHSGNAFQMMGHKNNPKVRSVLFLGIQEEVCIQSALCFGSLPLLRVLDLSRVKFEGGKLPSSIGELVHLRFLSLNKAGITHLPTSMRNLKLLLYLNLFVDVRQSVHVPNVLKEMKELRYLFLPYTMHDKTKLKLCDLVNLETLWCFSTDHTCVTDLLCMKKLRNLAVSYHGGCKFQTLTSTLSQLKNLQQLCLYDFMNGTRVADGRDFIQDFIYLKVLALGMRMPRLPDQHRFPPHVAHILLQFCYMEEDPMPILEKLHHLKWVELSCNAFSGRKMVCSKGGFPQLRALKLDEQEELEEWIVEEGSMSCLHSLGVMSCKMLKETPGGLKYITSLKELNIESMKNVWKDKLSQGGEDYYKVQHIPRIQFIKCDEE
ncbi:NB-ARC [Arabidopsis suecica]|uniref:NB-ARC n=1 Tax=Arabidopsis suecica TaxID=45249 RepID=A0A8T2BPV7_ARASU|nr:NB-ARC [Arabidopsis suecica]